MDMQYTVIHLQNVHAYPRNNFLKLILLLYVSTSRTFDASNIFLTHYMIAEVNKVG